MESSADGSARSLAPLPVRAHPLVLGVVLFLASELMFFAALFAAYYDLRANRAQWPPPMVHLDTAEAGFGTFLLFVASAVMVLATRAMDRGRLRAARWWTASAIVAAIGFVVVAIHGYAERRLHHRDQCVRLDLLRADRLSLAARPGRHRHPDGAA